MDIRMKSELTDDPKLSYETTQGRAYNASDLNSAKKMLAKWILDKKKMEIKESVWQGNIVSHRLYEETVDLSESGTAERILYWEG